MIAANFDTLVAAKSNQFINFITVIGASYEIISRINPIYSVKCSRATYTPEFSPIKMFNWVFLWVIKLFR